MNEEHAANEPDASDAKPAKTSVKVGAAKGWPMLQWVGKRPLTQVTAFPAQLVETFKAGDEEPSGPNWRDWPHKYPKGGLLFHGDNKEVLAHLLANGFRGKVNLIYIDPPFDSGADYVRQVSLRGARTNKSVEAEPLTLGEQSQYADIWVNDNYLQFIYERLLLLKELLAQSGTLFLHGDPSRGHHLRCLMDEVFGENNFVNEIIWSDRRWPSNSRAFQSMHDDLFCYAKNASGERPFHKRYEEASEGYMKRFGGKTQILDTETGTRKITSDVDTKGMPLRDVWDLSIVAGFKGERTGYPTQKPETLLERIVSVCSDPGDLILDCFAGSGTTAAVAQKLGRRWIVCDLNKGAIQTTAKRIQTIIRAQHEAHVMNGEATQTTLDIPDEAQGDDTAATVPASAAPAQFSFSHWRVNDYDLQRQHNEAVELACELLGVTRNRSDVYFDGTRGQMLVKIIPFNHPLSPIDLEQLRSELDVRRNEARQILLVCLGAELAAVAWLNDWNRLRGKDAPNRIEHIELRTDAKYGKLFEHKSAVAQVSMKATDAQLQIQIEDFLSPTILERLGQESGILQPKIDDWRSMVDCVLIDANFDGTVFNIVKADVPEKKTDLVSGTYTLPRPSRPVDVAVKIIDMLGEEVLSVLRYKA